MGQLEEARQLLDAMLADDPDRAPVLLERGRLALDMKQPAEAEAWLRRAVARAPVEFLAGWENKAGCYSPVGARAHQLIAGFCLRPAPPWWLRGGSGRGPGGDLQHH